MYKRFFIFKNNFIIIIDNSRIGTGLVTPLKGGNSVKN